MKRKVPILILRGPGDDPGTLSVMLPEYGPALPRARAIVGVMPRRWSDKNGETEGHEEHARGSLSK